MACSSSAHSASVVPWLPPAPLLLEPLAVALSDPLPTELLATLPVVAAPPAPLDPVEAMAPPEVVLGVEGLEQPVAVRKAARKKRDEVGFMISPVKGSLGASSETRIHREPARDSPASERQLAKRVFGMPSSRDVPVQ